MRDMPLPFEAEAKGGVGFLHKFCRDFSQEISGGVGGGGGGGYGGFVGGGDWGKFEAYFGGGGSGVVCDPEAAKRSPSPSSASTSTLSSSLAGGGGSTDTAAVATFSGNPSEKWPQGHPQNQQQETSTGNSSGGGNNVESSGNNNGGGGGGGCVNLELFQQMPANLDVVVGGGAEKCGGMEYWDPDLLEPVAGSPGQDQSIMRLIMGGDVEDPSMGLNKLLQQGSGVPPDLQFAGGAFLGLVDQGFGLDPGNNNNNNNKLLGSNNLFPVSNPSMLGNLRGGLTQNTSMFGSTGNNSSFPITLPIGVGGQLNPHAHMFEDCPDEKSHVLNHPQLLISQLQAQNPAFFMPLQHNNNQLDQHQHHHHQQQLPLAPPPKRHNPGVGPKPGGQFPLASCPQQLHLLPYMQQQQQQRPAMMAVTTKPPKMVAGDETMIQQQAIVDQLHKAAEHIELGNHILAQEILARLNHHLSPIGKPFYRAAFYFKEALRLLLMNNNNNSTASTITPTTLTTSSSPSSPFNLFFKIQAYKSFSEISPLIQFSNFTCNQAVLESLEGFDHIRIVDFDIGYGGQWASLMQELALRKGGAPAIKITAFASPATHDQLELSLTRENLVHFAQEINMSFEFEIINVDCLNSSTSWPLPYSGGPEPDAIAVNLPVSILSNNLVSPTMILRFIKQLAPKIVVSVDRGCDRTDLPFVHQVHQAFQSYLALLESLDAVNVGLDALQKIETFLIRPGIEKLILGRHSSPEKTQHWKTQFLAAGFSPLNFSNFTECQAEWLLKRTLARGFHVEKRQSSLVLYFQRKELISASAWRCC